MFKEDGLFIAQTESPFHKELIRNTFKNVESIFLAGFIHAIPTYPSGCGVLQWVQKNMIR